MVDAVQRKLEGFKSMVYGYLVYFFIAYCRCPHLCASVVAGLIPVQTVDIEVERLMKVGDGAA